MNQKSRKLQFVNDTTIHEDTVKRFFTVSSSIANKNSGHIQNTTQNISFFKKCYLTLENYIIGKLAQNACKMQQQQRNESLNRQLPGSLQELLVVLPPFYPLTHLPTSYLNI